LRHSCAESTVRIERISDGEAAIVSPTTTDGVIFGAGPFQVKDWPTDAASKTVFTAKESCWARQPLVDTIELTMGVDPQQQAKELLTNSGNQFSHPAPLALVYDFGDAEERAVAERVAVDVREVGIMVRVSGQAAGAKNSADVRLVRHRIVSPDRGTALLELLNSLGETATDMDTLDRLYAAERGLIDSFHVIPLVHVSESYGVGPQVRDWMPSRWGGWRLEDVRLRSSAPAGGTTP